MIPISACLIVRNEARRLDAALASLRQLLGLAEIVVLDTGSTDDTVAIAERHGARVHHDSWQDDFALHRNRCHALAQHDWIFKLDGDEELLLPGDVEACLAEPSVDGVSFEVECWTRGGCDTVVTQVRLYDRRKAAWKHAIHEQLLGLDNLVDGGGRVKAWYDPGERPEQNRRLAVMRACQVREPEELHWLIGLAQAAGNVGDWAEVLHWTDIALALPSEDGRMPMMAAWRASALMELGRIGETAQLVRTSLQRWPGHMDLHHVDVALRMAQWQKAIAAARRVAPGLPCESAAVADYIPAAQRRLGLPLRYSAVAEGRATPRRLLSRR